MVSRAQLCPRAMGEPLTPPGLELHWQPRGEFAIFLSRAHLERMLEFCFS